MLGQESGQSLTSGLTGAPTFFTTGCNRAAGAVRVDYLLARLSRYSP